MGQTAVYTLGIPYIDDNVASRESPLYFGKNTDSSPCLPFLLYRERGGERQQGSRKLLLSRLDAKERFARGRGGL